MGGGERLDQVVTGVECVALGVEAVRRTRGGRARSAGDAAVISARAASNDAIGRRRASTRGEAEAHAERRPGGDARLPVAEAERADVEVVRVVDVDEDVIVDVGVEPPFELAESGDELEHAVEGAGGAFGGLGVAGAALHDELEPQHADAGERAGRGRSARAG